MEVDELPNANTDEINNETSSEKIQPLHPPIGVTATDMATEKIHNGDGAAPFPVLDFPIYTASATSSKSKNNNVSTDIEKKEIPEFIRILRPHLPRKSKSRAYKMLQNIAKGIVLKSSFQQRIRKMKPKKRSVRKRKTRQLKKLTKSLSTVRRNERRLYSSSDSCRSNASCPHCAHCGYSCSRIARC